MVQSIKTHEKGYDEMKRMKISVLFLCALLLFCGCGSEKTSDPAETEKTRILGLDAETEETGEAETEEEPFSFPEIDLPAADPSVGKTALYTVLPEDSCENSDLLALQSLILCTGNTAEGTSALHEAAGFRVLTQKNFEKAPQSPDHTCAFTISDKSVLYRGEQRTLYLVSVRGTAGGEWYSNFDFIPSRKDDGVFSENFLFTAENVFLALRDCVKDENPLFLLCGHSRGAGCANLLGLLVNAAYGEENTFVYTFASPETLCGDPGVPDGNIFNYLNPRDLVPRLPLEGWGFSRAGNDIILSGKEPEEMTDALGTLLSLAPTPDQYYSARHSLENAGESGDGLTVYELFLLLGRALAGEETETGISSFSALSEESDLYPLTEVFDTLKENAGEVLRAHLPDAYAELIRERMTENGIH